MDLTIYSANPSEFDDKSSYLREIAEILKAAEPAATPVYMITNVHLGDVTFDCILLTEKGPILINGNPYLGKISGSENGVWKVETPSGQIVEMDNNPFVRSKIQWLAFLRKWRPVVDKHFTKQIPEKQILRVATWSYFQPGSEYCDDQFDFSKVKWFNVVTRDGLMDSIGKVKNQYRISKAGYDKILPELGVKVLTVSLKPDASGTMDQGTEGTSSITHEVQTPSGTVPLIVQKSDIHVVMPPRTKSRTPEFINAFDEAKISFELKDYEKSLRLTDYALKKGKYDQEAQDLKYDLLIILGKEDEAEEHLLKAVKG